MVDDFYTLSERLEFIAEEISDLLLERLRSAVEAGDTKPSADDKRLNRARNAIVKAAYLLKDMSSSGSDEIWSDE